MKTGFKKIAPAVTIIGVFYGILFALGITCPIKFVTGVSCPGCGMTRSYLSLLQLNFENAMYYHPLFIVPIIVAMLFLIKDRLPAKWYNGMMVVMIVVFVGVYIYRMIWGTGDIVVFEPENGVIFKIIKSLW